MYLFRTIWAGSAGIFFRGFAHNNRIALVDGNHAAARFYSNESSKKSDTGLAKTSPPDSKESSKKLSRSPFEVKDYDNKQEFVFQIKRGDFKGLEDAVLAEFKGVIAERALKELKRYFIVNDFEVPKDEEMRVKAGLGSNGDLRYLFYRAPRDQP